MTSMQPPVVVAAPAAWAVPAPDAALRAAARAGAGFGAGFGASASASASASAQLLRRAGVGAGAGAAAGVRRDDLDDDDGGSGRPLARPMPIPANAPATCAQGSAFAHARSRSSSRRSSVQRSRPSSADPRRRQSVASSAATGPRVSRRPASATRRGHFPTRNLSLSELARRKRQGDGHPPRPSWVTVGGHSLNTLFSQPVLTRHFKSKAEVVKDAVPAPATLRPAGRSLTKPRAYTSALEQRFGTRRYSATDRVHQPDDTAMQLQYDHPSGRLSAASLRKLQPAPAYVVSSS